MIDKRYEEIKNDFDKAAELAYNSGGAVCIKQEGRDDLLLISKEYLNERIRDIVVCEMLDESEAEERLGIPTIPFDELKRNIDGIIKNAKIQNRIPS